MKRVKDRYYLLDSFNESPVVWTNSSFVEEYLQSIMFQQDGYLLWVRKQE